MPIRRISRDVASEENKRQKHSRPSQVGREGMQSKLGLDKTKVERARELAVNIVAPVQGYIDRHTTISIERATLRMMGVDGVRTDGVPVPNMIADMFKEHMGEGVSRYFISACVRENCSIEQMSGRIACGYDISSMPLLDFNRIEEKSNELVAEFVSRVKGNAEIRNDKLEEFKTNAKTPMLYVIVATGNIYEDVKQADAAIVQGADVIAVIRTTAQSLLDYVPHGATTEGFGGTCATQENFRIMRRQLDESGERVKRYIRLTNYCSGLCMPEIAVMGALERLDMMLNDSMYGILFRDINANRTFIDQHFSRMINAFAGIIINTGEDNYLTTSDAMEKAHTVLASQLINERFAFNAGLPPGLLGLGHAFEIDPGIKNGFLYELAQAQLAREIFPKHPLKYMPPTKFMTGNLFKGLAMNTMFNFVSKATRQEIHLLGMLTEAIHTPFLQDRFLAIENAQYIMNNMAGLHDDIEFRQDGIVVGRARKVLDQSIAFLEEVEREGLFDAIGEGFFADIKRPRNGGKGAEGVFEKSSSYWNPFSNYLRHELKIDVEGRT